MLKKLAPFEDRINDFTDFETFQGVASCAKQDNTNIAKENFKPMFNQKLLKHKPQELRSESRCSTMTNMNNTFNMPIPSWGGEIRSAEDPNHSIK